MSVYKSRRFFLFAAAAAAGCQTGLRGSSAQVPAKAWDTAAPPNASASGALEALLSKLKTSYPQFLDGIRKEKALTPDLEATLKKALEEVSKGFK